MSLDVFTYSLNTFWSNVSTEAVMSCGIEWVITCEWLSDNAVVSPQNVQSQNLSCKCSFIPWWQPFISFCIVNQWKPNMKFMSWHTPTERCRHTLSVSTAHKAEGESMSLRQGVSGRSLMTTPSQGCMQCFYYFALLPSPFPLVRSRATLNQLGSLRECSKLPQRCPRQNLWQKRILCTVQLSEVILSMLKYMFYITWSEKQG